MRALGEEGRIVDLENTPLSLTAPEPVVRPGGTPDFSNVPIAEAGSVPRPAVDVDPREIRDMAFLDHPRAQPAR